MSLDPEPSFCGVSAQRWVMWPETGFSWDSGVCGRLCVCEITHPAHLPRSSSNLEGMVTSSPCYPSPTSFRSQALQWASENNSQTALPDLLLLCLGSQAITIGLDSLAAAEQPHVRVQWVQAIFFK